MKGGKRPLKIYRSTIQKKNKTDLRDTLGGRLKQVEDVNKRSISIIERIKGLIDEGNCTKALVYCSKDLEVQMQSLTKWLLDRGINTYIPYIVKNNRLNLFRLKGLDYKKDLTKGCYGIFEPKARFKESGINHESLSLDLVIVPGLGFTRSGKRLGRGGGYYDRFLSQHQEVKKIGVCFAEQIMDDLPIEDHDVRMDKVIYA